MRRLLLIAYSYPPIGARSHRAAKFAKYLSRFGWWPVVVTPRAPYAPDVDLQLEEESRAYPATVHHTGSFEPVWMIRRLKRATGAGAGAPRPGFRIARWLRANFAIPDYRLGWVPWATAKGWRLIRRERIDAIMVSVEPHSSLLAGVLLKRLTGRPLLVDFRDEWVPLAKYRDPDKLSAVIAFEAWLERILVRQADAIVTVTPAVRDNFRRRYPALADRVHCIPNGWDAEDFAGEPPARERDGRLVMTHAGTLYANRFPNGLLAAVRALLDEQPVLRDRVRLRFIGAVDGEAQRALAEFPFPNVIECLGRRPSRDIPGLLRASDVLVLQEERDPVVGQRYVPSKLYDYVGAGRFVLALAGAGVIQDTVEATGAGLAVAPDDLGAIRQAVLARLSAGNGHGRATEEQARARQALTREALTRQLAALLDRLVAPRPGAA